MPLPWKGLMLFSQNGMAFPRADLCAGMPHCVLDLFCMQMALLLLFHHMTLQKKLFLEADKMQLPNLELPASKAMR